MAIWAECRVFFICSYLVPQWNITHYPCTGGCSRRLLVCLMMRTTLLIITLLDRFDRDKNHLDQNFERNIFWEEHFSPKSIFVTVIAKKHVFWPKFQNFRLSGMWKAASNTAPNWFTKNLTCSYIISEHFPQILRCYIMWSSHNKSIISLSPYLHWQVHALFSPLRPIIIR